MTDTGATLFLYTTLPDAAAAERLAEALVAERLAACCHIIGPMTSVYRWDGRIVRDPELALWAKTTRDRADAAAACIRAAHPYTLPCILEIPASGGDPAYLAWVRDETRPAP